MNPTTIGFLRGLAYVVIFAVIHFIATATNLSDVFGTSLGGIVAMIAAAADHYLEEQGKGALFGVAK